MAKKATSPGCDEGNRMRKGLAACDLETPGRRVEGSRINRFLVGGRRGASWPSSRVSDGGGAMMPAGWRSWTHPADQEGQKSKRLKVVK